MCCIIDSKTYFSQQDINVSSIIHESNCHATWKIDYKYNYLYKLTCFVSGLIIEETQLRTYQVRFSFKFYMMHSHFLSLISDMFYCISIVTIDSRVLSLMRQMKNIGIIYNVTHKHFLLLIMAVMPKWLLTNAVQQVSGQTFEPGTCWFETDYFTVMFGARKCCPITTHYLQTLNA